MTVEELAEEMYENCTTYGKPRWDQLGSTTRGLWIERAQEKLDEKAAESDRC